MMTITLLGGGNLANHLTNVLLNSNGCDLSQIYNRSIEKIRHFEKQTKITNNLDDLRDTDIYILCIKDIAIKEVSAKIAHKEGLIVHTSGALAMEVLQNNLRKGVFYPLQTFSKEKNLSFDNIPICIEAARPKDLEILTFISNTSLQKSVQHQFSSKKKNTSSRSICQ